MLQINHDSGPNKSVAESGTGSEVERQIIAKLNWKTSKSVTFSLKYGFVVIIPLRVSFNSTGCTNVVFLTRCVMGSNQSFPLDIRKKNKLVD